MDRSRLVTTILIVIVVVLVGQVFWQQRRSSQLQASMEFQQKQFDQQAGKLAAEKLKGYRADVMQAAQWLHEYYKSDEGLRRPDGLWRSDQKQPDFEAFRKGVELVYAKLAETLRAEGLERIEAEGKPFDPNEHEAMMQTGEGDGEPHVAEVFRPGYTLRGTVIRPASVRVERSER